MRYYIYIYIYIYICLLYSKNLKILFTKNSQIQEVSIQFALVNSHKILLGFWKHHTSKDIIRRASFSFLLVNVRKKVQPFYVNMHFQYSIKINDTFLNEKNKNKKPHGPKMRARLLYIYRLTQRKLSYTPMKFLNFTNECSKVNSYLIKYIYKK